MKSGFRKLPHSDISVVATGAGFAAYAAFVAVTWMLVCGTSLPSLVALCLSIAVGCIIAVRVVAATADASLKFEGYAGFLIAISWLLPTVMDGCLTAGVFVFRSWIWLSFVGSGMIVCLLTTALVSWALVHRPGLTACTRSDLCAGASLGLLLPLLHTAAPIPMALPVTVALLISLVLHRLSNHQESVEAVIDRQPAEMDGFRPPVWAAGAAALALGIVIHALTRQMGLLMPISAGLLCLSGSLTALMLAVVIRMPVRTFVSEGNRAGLFVILLALVPLSGDGMVELNLRLTATTHWPVLLLIARSLQLGILLTVAIAAVPWRSLNAASDSPIEPLRTAGLIILGVAAGFLLITIDVRWEFLIGLSILAFTYIWGPVRASDAEVSARKMSSLLARGTFAVTACLSCLTFTLLFPFDASESIQLLFNGRSAQGYRIGLDRHVLLQSDSTRLLEACHTTAGDLSVWRTKGDQIQFRRNGLPVNEATTNAYTTPQPIAESLTVLLPLVLHSNPGSILLLGDDAGVGLRVASGFPTHTIRAVRSDRATTDVASRLVWDSLEISPWKDDRISISHEPIATAIRRNDSEQKWDVIVTDPPVPASTTAQEQYTREFYAAVGRQLSAEGVFCQRIAQHDLGSAALLRIMSSLELEFDRVLAIRLSPGQVAVVAGRIPESLLDGATLDRLQKSHVSRELSRSGWDWSQVAGLPVVDTSDPVGVFEHTPRLTPSSVGNGYFAFALPMEVNRRADKAGELRVTFAPHQRRLADAIPRGKAYEEFARRYSAVVQQLEILTNFPDQPWTYRKSLKSELQRNPRPPVEYVSDGTLIRKTHPLDEVRKNYFVTLGEALQEAATGSVDPLVMRRLAAFTATYEPLLSHFAHHELVRIHEIADHPSPAMELRHRLHTVYFTEPADFSIRQVADAIAQILDDPALLSSDQERFDHVNSMLQELVQRWERRQGYVPPSARRTQRDVDHCVYIANRALDAMQDWAPSAGFSADDLRYRRRFVTAALISPLRDYREQVLAHRIRTETPVDDHLADEGADALPLLIDPQNLTTN